MITTFETDDLLYRMNLNCKVMRKIYRALAIVLVYQSAVAQDPAPVKVEQGAVQGIIENGLTVYKGIPFASPPVGELRWRAPQPAPLWKGIKQANKFAPAPIQGGTPPSGKSEDCLYLNVWTPAKTGNEKIYGINFLLCL